MKLEKETLRRTDLTPADKLVLASIQDRIGNNGEAWPGLRRIALDCGIGNGTASECIRRLTSKGALKKRKPSGDRATSTYSLPTRSDSERPTRSETELQRSDSELKRSESERNSPKGTEPNEPTLSLLAKGRSVSSLKGKSLDTDTFRAAFERWLAHLAEKGKHPTNEAIRAQLKRLESLGHDAAIAVIEWSIERDAKNLIADESCKERPQPATDQRGAGAHGGKAGRFTAHPKLDEPAKAVRTYTG